MSDKNDCLPAFPSQGLNDGMTLLDYFAAKALDGIFSSIQFSERSIAGIAKECYILADAMLAARDK